VTCPDAGCRPGLRVARTQQGLLETGRWVDDIVATLGLSPRCAYALRLCTEEAVANIVMHGLPRGDGADMVALRLDVESADCLVLTVEDGCAAFDPSSAPSPIPPASLAEAPIGGLGIHLMRQYASALSYRREGDTNRLTITIVRL
jgi:anti-sigma regulatory factor (Ser/Thr protein kinase)